MANIDNPSWLSHFITSHFNKQVFPYWCVVLADMAIVFVLTAFVHWAFHRTGATYEHRFTLLYTMLVMSNFEPSFFGKGKWTFGSIE